jgi:CRP-like cAMP-binding protein
VDAKGQEHITSFAKENWWPGDCESLATGSPSNYNIDAIEDSLLFLVPKDKFDQVCDEIQPLKDMMTDLYRKGFIAAQNRINAFMSYTAEEKYAFFLRQHSDFASRVPQGMIASFLGITPETLSRIRKVYFMQQKGTRIKE